VLYDLFKLLAYSYKIMFSTETIERLLQVIPHNELYSSPIKGLFLRHSDQPFCYEGIIQGANNATDLIINILCFAQ